MTQHSGILDAYAFRTTVSPMRSAPRRPLKKPLVKEPTRALPSPAALILRGRVTFVLYALWFVGCLTVVTALIERAAP